jgi:hypothetical protein
VLLVVTETRNEAMRVVSKQICSLIGLHRQCKNALSLQACLRYEV